VFPQSNLNIVTLLLQIFNFFANRCDNNEPSFFDGITMVDLHKVVGNHISAWQSISPAMPSASADMDPTGTSK
jgi:hypothetical protein